MVLSDLKTSDWVLIVTTLILAISALFVPYIAEWLKRKWFAPRLDILFENTPDLCHKTKIRQINGTLEPDYYFRFYVINEGVEPAKQCEIVIEKLWIFDSVILP